MEIIRYRLRNEQGKDGDSGNGAAHRSAGGNAGIAGGNTGFADENAGIAYGVVGDGTVRQITGSIFDAKPATAGEEIPLDAVELLAPLEPGKIIALGYNYKDLVGERDAYDEPVIFFKPPSAVIGPGGEIVIREDNKVWTEVELAIVIRKECRDVTVSQAPDCILGYTVANDVTTSNCLGRDHHLARSKGWDTFCPLGPAIVSGVDTSALPMTNTINGTVMQQSATDKRILGDAEVVSFLSRFFTLFPGDVILTGTPANAESSVIAGGEVVEVSIDGIGTLTNTVRTDY